jgi:hypothetical protein
MQNLNKFLFQPRKFYCLIKFGFITKFGVKFSKISKFIVLKFDCKFLILESYLF